MRNLCIPSKANGYKPKVPAKCLRHPGDMRGTWYIPLRALIAFINELPTPGMKLEPAAASVVVGGGSPELLTVRQVAERWKKFGITEGQVRRLHRRKVLRASPLRKCPLLFPLKSVIAAEEAMR